MHFCRCNLNRIGRSSRGTALTFRKKLSILYTPKASVRMLRPIPTAFWRGHKDFLISDCALVADSLSLRRIFLTTDLDAIAFHAKRSVRISIFQCPSSDSTKTMTHWPAGPTNKSKSGFCSLCFWPGFGSIPRAPHATLNGYCREHACLSERWRAGWPEGEAIEDAPAPRRRAPRRKS